MAELAATVAATVRDQITATLQHQMQECLAPIKADMNTMKDEIKAARASINSMRVDIQAKATRADVITMRTAIQELTQNIEQLTNKVSDIERQQGLTQRLAAIVCDCPIYPSCYNIDVHYQLYNRSQGTAGGVELEVVPFKDGDNPTKAPVST